MEDNVKRPVDDDLLNGHVEIEWRASEDVLPVSTDDATPVSNDESLPIPSCDTASVPTDDALPVSSRLVYVNISEEAALSLQNSDGISVSIEDVQAISLPVDEAVGTTCCIDDEGHELGAIPYFTVNSSNLYNLQVVSEEEQNATGNSNDCLQILPEEYDHEEELCLDQSDIMNLNHNIASEVSIKSQCSDDSSTHSDSSIAKALLSKNSQGKNCNEKPIDETSVRRSSRIRSIKEKGKKDTKKSKIKSNSLTPARKKESDNGLSEKNNGTKTNKSPKISRGKTKRKLSNSSENLNSDILEEKPKDSSNDKVPTEDDLRKEEIIVKKDVPPTNTSSEEKNTLDVTSPVVVENSVSIPLVNSDNLQTQLLNTSLPAPESLQSQDKGHAEDLVTVKPEKVKSRWRRHSELEHGDLFVPVNVQTEPSDVRTSTPDIVKDILQPIMEELTVAATKSSSEIKETPPNFDMIDSNIYRFERKKCKTKKEARRMLCDCSLTEEEIERNIIGCDDDCLNRLLMIECGSRCANGDYCSNKRFQKKQYVKLEPFKTEKKGWGLQVLESAPVGSFVIEYVGEVLSRPDFKQRVKQYAREKCPHYYFMALKSDEIIDATYKGNISRFINHSCSPNCETQKWTVNGELRIGFFAKTEINAGDELTFDYKFQRYGREAQTCHCESENCTGFIGESKQLSLDSNVSSKAVSKRKKATEEKKRQAFEDMMFNEELEKLCSNGGLRNRAETLILARLMVRAEDANSRLCLLDVILKTTEAACLRLFLDYHGLSLMWSWMADVTDLQLKSKIIEALSLLPVSNKTVLLDSKVLNVVQKWSDDPNHGLKRSIEAVAPLTTANSSESSCKKQKISDISDSDETNSTPVLSSEEGTESNDTSQPEDMPLAPKMEAGDAENTTDKLKEFTAENNSEGSELTERAAKLLQSWSNLAEVFRIPRVEQQKRIADELEADGGTVSNSPQAAVSNDSSQKDKLSPDISNQEAKSEPFPIEKGMKIENIGDRKFFMTKIPAIVTEESKRPRKTLLPTPPRLTKEERRHLFAMEVQQRDQEALRKQCEEGAEGYQNEGYPTEDYPTEDYPTEDYPTENYPTEDYSQSYSNGYFYGENEFVPAVAAQGTYPDNTSVPYLNDIQAGIQATHLPPPGYPENVHMNVPPPQYAEPPPHIPFPPPGMIFSAPPPQLQFPPPSLSQPPPAIINNPVNLPGPGISSIPNLCAIPPSTIPIIPTSVPPIGVPPPLGIQKALPISVSAPISHGPPAAVAPTPTMLPHAYQTPVSAPPAGVSMPVQYVPVVTSFSAPGQQPYYTYSQSSSAPVSVPEEYPTEHVALSGPVAVPAVIRLPPNWKTATDSEGTIYYYNRITRETQWDPPEYEEDLEEDSDTPVYDEPNILVQTRRRGTTTAAADTSFAVEVAKKIKELFRTKMSAFVISCLNAYRKPDCYVGKIQSTEDFKYLARKLTHFVMAKELKHCRNVEELDCNDNVKRKAKDYITKYMSKMGQYYDKDKTD